MKRSVYSFVLLWFTVGLSNCKPDLGGPTAFNVAGVYQLIWYIRATTSDDNPSGTIQVTQVDEDHINLVIEGQSGKTKIKYTYNDVIVSDNGDDSNGQITYNLTYKKKVIGTARIDGVSRYLVLTPSNNLRLEGLEL